jgi:hypothetical protein
MSQGSSQGGFGSRKKSRSPLATLQAFKCDTCSKPFSTYVSANMHVLSSLMCKSKAGKNGFPPIAATAKTSGTKRQLPPLPSSGHSTEGKKHDSGGAPAHDSLSLPQGENVQQDYMWVEPSQEHHDMWDEQHDTAPDMEMAEAEMTGPAVVWPFAERWRDFDSFVEWTKNSDPITRCTLTPFVTRCTLLLLPVPSLPFLTTCTHPFTLRVL